MRAVAIGELIPGGCDGDLERPGVGIFRRDARAVAGRLAVDGVPADGVPQPGYEGLDCIAGGGRRYLPTGRLGECRRAQHDQG